MITAILSAISAIPKLISAIENLMALFQKMDLENRLQRVEDAFVKLEAAKTLEDKKNAAKDIQSSISG